MTEFSTLSIKETISSLKNKDFSVSELVDSHISSMESGRELNAFITETADTVSYTHLTLPTTPYV